MKLLQSEEANQRIIEAIFASLAVVLMWCLYSPIGTLNSLRGVNYASFLLNTLDAQIPFVAFPIYAYSIAFFVVPVVAVACVLIRFNDKVHVRMLLSSFFPMMLLAFTIFTLMPVSIITEKTIPDLTGLQGLKLALLQGTYSITNPWNAFPSIHIATGVLGFRFLQSTFSSRWLLGIYTAWFLVMATGTLTLQYHSIADVVAGFLLAEFSFRIARKYKDRISEYYERFSRTFRIAAWLVFIGILISAHGLAYYYELYQGTI